MLKIEPKFLKDAKAGNYNPNLLGIIKSLLYKYSKLYSEQNIIGSEIILLDISFYQSVANFSKMKENGIDGVIIRAGQNKWEDTSARTFMTNAELAGMPIGSYWFYDSRVDYKIQAAKWKEVLGDHKIPLMCWADYEESYGGMFGGWRNLYNFLEECKRIMPDRKFGIYTGYYYWLEHSPILASQLEYFAKYPLWIAWYTDDFTRVRIPRPWTKALMWQRSSNGDGTKYGVGSLSVDMNLFVGGIEEFNALIENQEPIPPTPPAPLPVPDNTPELDGELYRIVWDDENPDYNNKCRTQMPKWKGPKAPPAVLRFYPEMREKSGDYRVNISSWKNFFLWLNNGDKQKFAYWTGKSRAQFNKTGFPKLAYLVMSGNVVRGMVIGNWLKFRTLKPTDLSKAWGMTRRTNPDLIHTFTCVKYKNKQTIHILDTGTKRGTIDYPVISKEGYGYIPLRHVRKL